MPEIGETLREARMRENLDISEVEVDTKIRAKYLRALENEEWDVLPGDTFVRTFLRTYATYLKLDARELVEDYKVRFERPVPTSVHSSGLPSSRAPRERRRPQLRITAVPLFIVGVLALVSVLYFMGEGKDQSDTKTAQPPQQRPAVTAATAVVKKRPQPKPTEIRLEIKPQKPVFVCLIGNSGEALIRGIKVLPGDNRVHTSRAFKVTFGSGHVRAKANGKLLPIPDTAEPIGYYLRIGHPPVKLAASERPTCRGSISR